MRTDTQILRKLDFFQPLEDKIITKIAKMCIVREFPAGDYIIRRGESGLGLYFITRGRAKVEIDRNGVKAVVAELRDGDFLGELSMIDEKERSADVICLEDTTCMLLTRDSFTKLLNKYPQIAVQIAKSLVSRIRATNERVVATPPPPPAAVVLLNPALPAAMTNASSRNGSLRILQSYTSTKAKARDMLVDLFGSLYLMKMMTRFSMAMMGCPVALEAEGERSQVISAELEGVKFAFFPASSDRTLRIEAFGDGEFSATVFRPAGRGTRAKLSVSSFEGRVVKDEILLLHVPAQGETNLERAASAPFLVRHS